MMYCEEIDQKQFTVILADRREALIRPMNPDDRGRVARGMELLALKSRPSRFSTLPWQSGGDRFTYSMEVDQRDEAAWIAVNSAAHGEPGFGSAQYVRLEHEPQVAELALTVADRSLGNGLDAYLLATLYLSALESDIETLRAIVPAENRRMMRWLFDIGASSCFADGLCRLDLPVRHHEFEWSQTSSARRFKKKLDELRGQLQ
jgi:hypothetical protein